VKSLLVTLIAGWLTLGVSSLEGQMMGGGRELRGGREVMSERLASASPDQRAWLEAVRDERTGLRAVAQRVTIRAGLRTYSLGSTEVSEALALTTYSLRRDGMRLRVAGGTLRFANGDRLTIAGVAPLDARLDLAVGARDSVRVGVRVPSSPMTLSGPQVAALASVATATVDLSSVEFGTQASFTAGYARTHPLGASVVVSGTIGADYEPRPSSARWSYWRGTTLRGGARVSGVVGPSQWSARVEVTRSFSDSLAGRNLFQGGGTVLVRTGVASYVGDADQLVLDVSAFYFRPFSTERTDALSRRVPVGDFVGGSAIGIVPLGVLLVTPTFVITRESSHAAAGSTLSRASGWATLSSLAVDVPLASRWSLTPELGYAKGSLRRDIGDVGTAPGFGITESLTGWWLAADVSVSF
jgi:hypothetical protein